MGNIHKQLIAGMSETRLNWLDQKSQNMAEEYPDVNDRREAFMESFLKALGSASLANPEKETFLNSLRNCKSDSEINSVLDQYLEY